MNLFYLASSAADAPQGGDILTMLVSMSPILLVVVFFYFFIMRPQKKREKKEAAMRDSLQVGDEIVTIGGIVGIVVNIKADSDTILIETGGDRNKLRIKKSAIQTVETIHDTDEA